MNSPEATYEKVRLSLVEDLPAAHMHYYQYAAVRKAIPTYRLAINRAKQFWSLFLNAHLEATHMSLARLYDQHRNVASFSNWLLHIKEHSEILEIDESRIVNEFNSRPLGDTEFQEDLALVSKNDRLVKHLTIQRGNVYAHRTVSGDVDQLLSDYPLTFDDFDYLLERGKCLLNRYRVLYDGECFAMNSIDPDDYKVVLSACSAH